MVGRLVKNQELRILGEYLGQEDALLLAAGEGQHIPAAHFRRPGEGQGFPGFPRFIRVPAAQESAAAGITAHPDDLLHSKTVDRSMVLAQDPDLPRVFHGRKGPELPALQRDLPLAGNRPAEGTGQGAFPRAVGTDHTPPFSLPHFKGKILQDCFFTEADRQVFCFQHQTTPPFRLR